MATMNTPKPIQIFKPGKRTAMSGVTLEFSESDMAACAAAYDPAKHEAPLVVGHPKHNKPRFGGVSAVNFADGILSAEPKDVLPEFAEWVEKKMFPHVSASFYLPDAPGNPVPGTLYLRHVGFLGAQPPAVKGLNEHGISFADDEEGVVVFAEYDDVIVSRLLRNLRDWFISKWGKDEADKVLPSWDVSTIEQSAQDELRESQQEDQSASATAPAFAEPQPKGDEMSAEDKAELARLKAENEKFKAEQVEFAEAENKRKVEARHVEHVAFAEGLVKEGKLLPVHKDSTVATLDFMSSQEQVVEFGEGDAKKPLVEVHKAFLQAQPKQVDFSEAAGAAGDAAGVVNFAAPSGYGVDSDRLVLHSKAVAYQSANKTTYEAALAAVSA